MKLSLIKSLALSLALTVTAPWLASAADEGGKGGRHGHGDWLQATLGKLDLTDDQKAKIKVITNKAAADREEFTKAHADELKAAKDSKDREKMHSIMAPLMEKRKATLDEIKAVLTDEQKQKLAEAMPAHSEHGKKKE